MIIRKRLEKFFVYFFTGVSIFIVILGIQRSKAVDAFNIASVPEDNSKDQTPSDPSQLASVFDAASPSAISKVLGTSETISESGASIPTPWGELATSIKVRDGKIISVDIPKIPNSPQSIYAKPILINATLKSGTANVQAVSGATITSNAFRASLESAITKIKARNPKAVGAIALNIKKNPVANNNQQVVDLSKIVLDNTPKATPVVPVVTPDVVPSGISGTFTGDAFSTPWGDTVASITLTNGKITGVTMPTVPNSPPSAYAKPYLIEQALYAGSANIQGVSGATIVTNAFKLSLESAIARAKGQLVTPVVTPTVQPTLPPPTPPPAPVPTPIIIPPTVVQPTTPPPPSAPLNVSGTFTGNAYSTPWGNAVASVTFTNGVITGVTMPTVPNSPPSIQAQPYLVQQALAAGSANIQGVSGATYTSNAFKLSLENAISKASAQGTVSSPSTGATTTTAPTPVPTTTTTTRTRVRSNDDD